MARIISAVFDDRRDAERAVNWLRDNGVPDDAISVVGRHEEEGRETGNAALSGLGIGAGVGALFGLAAALIPGIGPFIAAGPLAAALGATGGAIASGAIVGGVSGGIAGALSHWGLSEHEARHYAGEVERGGIYVGVDLDRANLSEDAVRDAFRRFNGRTMEAAPGAPGAVAEGIGEMRVAGVREEARPIGEVEVREEVTAVEEDVEAPARTMDRRIV